LSHGVKTEWSGVLQEAYRSDENANAKMARLGIDDGLEDQYEDRKWGLYKMASEAYTQELATPYGCTARETIIERQRLRVREETQRSDQESEDGELATKVCPQTILSLQTTVCLQTILCLQTGTCLQTILCLR
jgi:hypothetical protein